MSDVQVSEVQMSSEAHMPEVQVSKIQMSSEVGRPSWWSLTALHGHPSVVSWQCQEYQAASSACTLLPTQ